MKPVLNIKKSIIQVGLGKGGMISLQFLSSIILARLLSPEDYGIAAALAIFISLSTMLVDSGFGGSIVYRRDVDDRDYSTIFWLNMIISLVLYGLMFGFANAISQFYNTPQIKVYIKILGLVVVFNALGHIQFNQLYKFLEFKKINTINLLSYFLAFIIAFFLAYKKQGVWALICQQVLYSIFSTIAYIIVNKFRPKLFFSWKIVKKHWSFGSGLFFSTILKTIYDNMYLQLISKFVDVRSAGLYNQANKLKEIPSSFASSTFETSLFPLFSKIEDKQEFSLKFRKISSLLAFFCAPMFTLLCLLAEPTIKLLLGEKWIEASDLLSILSVGAFFYVMESINRSGLKSRGLSMLIFKIDLFKRSTAILIMSIALWKFGIYGIACSFILNSFIGWFVNVLFLSKHIQYSKCQQLLDVIKPLIISTSGIFVIYIIETAICLNSTISIIFGCLCMFVFFSLINFLIKDKSFVRISHYIKSHFTHKKQ